MKAKDGIVDLLNRVLTENLTAINQYFVYGRTCAFSPSVSLRLDSSASP